MKKICLTCNKEYIPDRASGSRFEKSKYCCIRCKQKGWKRKDFSYICLYCKDKYKRKQKTDNKFCSKKCNIAYDKRGFVRFQKVENGIVKFGDNLLTLKNYKEPLRRIETTKGYGWYGTLASTVDNKYIQCHICGELKSHLPGHIFGKHKMRIIEYKDKFGLSHSTALISEQQRNEQKLRYLENIKNMTDEQRDNLKKNLMEGHKHRSKNQPKSSLEQKNRRGTCPDQLLDRIKKVSESLGRTPSLVEFMEETGGQRYKHLIFKTFGSWKNAITRIGLDLKVPNISRKGGNRYDREYLLDMLRLYAEENRKVPTFSDSKRGLIPDYKSYIREFGSIETARQEAGVYDFIDQEDIKIFRIKAHI